METRKKLTRDFSVRLVEALKKRGYASSVAASGVKTKEMAKRLGCSIQMARRYVMGEALPELAALLVLAKWLEMSPAYLLFGSEGSATSSATLPASAIWRYVLRQLAPYWQQIDRHDEVIEFVIELVYDASHLVTEKTMLYKILDVALKAFLQHRLPKKKRLEQVS